jgi:hypothetical protein
MSRSRAPHSQLTQQVGADLFAFDGRFSKRVKLATSADDDVYAPLVVQEEGIRAVTFKDVDGDGTSLIHSGYAAMDEGEVFPIDNLHRHPIDLVGVHFSRQYNSSGGMFKLVFYDTAGSADGTETEVFTLVIDAHTSHVQTVTLPAPVRFEAGISTRFVNMDNTTGPTAEIVTLFYRELTYTTPFPLPFPSVTPPPEEGQVYSVVITETGSGYTETPTVTFSAPTGPGGVTAEGEPVIFAGSIQSITITNPGSGYGIVPPTVTIGVPTEVGGLQAEALATIVTNVVSVEEGGSIQAAIDASSSGAVIVVGPGTFTENIVLNKDRVHLLATESAAVVGTIRLEANTISIRGFVIDGVQNNLGNRGVAIAGGENITVRDMTINNFTTGISMDFASALPTPSNVSIEGTTFTNNIAGVGSTENVTRLSLTQNSFTSNQEGVGLGSGVTFRTEVDIEDIFQANTFSGNTVAIADYRSGSPPQTYDNNGDVISV